LQWDNWLVDVDPVNALAPTGYDDYAARLRVKALGQPLRALSPHIKCDPIAQICIKTAPGWLAAASLQKAIRESCVS